MAPELVIFDCDGVLVDSEPLSNRVLAEELTAIGLPTTTEDSVRDYMGRSWATCSALIEERLGRPLPADFGARYHDRLFELFRRELVAVSGVEAALGAIEAPTCVASSGSHERIRLALEVTGLLDRFDGRIFSATDVVYGKPAPDLFLHAAERIGVAPERCVVVEDSPAGVEAGRSAGMQVLAYASHGDAPALAAAGARVFADMSELPGLLVSDSAPRSGAAQ
jgi:HAD superfamily hydrolase (TIGR01509 family)